MDSINISLLTLYAAQTNSPATELFGDVDASTTTIYVKEGDILPKEVPFLLTLGFDTSESETVLVTAANGDELTVVRGVDGPALSWVANTKCARMFTAKDLNDVQANLAALGDGIDDARIAVDMLVAFLNRKVTEYDAGLEKTTKRTDMIQGSITLKNTQKFPFNDSVATAPIDVQRENVNYLVDYHVVSSKGNVGDIIVSDKLLNGFKVEFTGSATEVVLKYQVLGGMN